MNSRGGPLSTDRPTAENTNPGEKFALTIPRRTDRAAQVAPTTPVVAPCWPVLGGTGRVRYAVLYPCPAAGCGGTHLAHVRGYVPARVERRLPCGGGTVVLLPVLKGLRSAVVA
jgi:hypothetical protein